VKADLLMHEFNQVLFGAALFCCGISSLITQMAPDGGRAIPFNSHRSAAYAGGYC